MEKCVAIGGITCARAIPPNNSYSYDCLIFETVEITTVNVMLTLHNKALITAHKHTAT